MGLYIYILSGLVGILIIITDKAIIGITRITINQPVFHGMGKRGIFHGSCNVVVFQCQPPTISGWFTHHVRSFFWDLALPCFTTLIKDLVKLVDTYNPKYHPNIIIIIILGLYLTTRSSWTWQANEWGGLFLHSSTMSHCTNGSICSIATFGSPSEPSHSTNGLDNQPGNWLSDWKPQSKWRFIAEKVIHKWGMLNPIKSY